MNNILITSAGGRVSLVNFFKTELKKKFPNALVMSTDMNPKYAAACHISDYFFEVPNVTHENYIDTLLNLAINNNVKLIIPTIDTELLTLSQNKNRFKNHGIDIVISDFEIIKIFRDKRLTHQFFEKIGINIAKEYTKSSYSFPLYIKPIDGSRSVDNYIIEQKEQLMDFHFTNEKLMFLEYLDHKKHFEYTLDLYYDRNSVLKCLIPRKRLEVRSGEVNKAITKVTDFINEIWGKMENIIGFRGCITMQVFINIDTNKIYGIEINPRFGGGYPLSYLSGGNYVKWIIEEYLLNKKIKVFKTWEKNLLMLRYDKEILVRNFKD